MAATISFEKTKEVLRNLTAQAEEMLNDPDKVEKMLQDLEARMRTVPKVGDTLALLPLMISMIRAYVRKEYTEVSKKTIASMMGAGLYLLVGRDLIPDKTPIVGLFDDIAVLGAALKLSEKELNDYSAWRSTL
ncbi:MAG: DUF1232 domain-containing protein [Firmicutes bacterium]|nr:DUF1232 domain-containing protein [Bacillota bacterium]MBR0482068.1 DUF1232 domain-containing protein [Bacillota bacterium]